jgi:hypothetical protein
MCTLEGHARNKTAQLALNIYYRRQQRDWSLAVSKGEARQLELFTGFICQECRVEVDIRFRQKAILIFAWKHVGTLEKGIGERMIWPRRLGSYLRLPFRRQTFETRLLKDGVLKSGDLKEEWENIPSKDKGSSAHD